MDSVVKRLKVITIIFDYSYDKNYADYLTACEDEIGVTIRHSRKLTIGDNLAPENIKWRIEWLPNDNCYFWSCYNKLLAVDYDDQYMRCAFQSKLPVKSAEWCPNFKIESSRSSELVMYMSFAGARYFLVGINNGPCWMKPSKHWYKRINPNKCQFQVLEVARETEANEERPDNSGHGGHAGGAAPYYGGHGGGDARYISNYIEKAVHYDSGAAHYNSGHNILTGSGTQTNGNVKVGN